MYVLTLATEVGAVAAITALALAVAVALSGPIHTPARALVVGAIAGACIHLAFEGAQMNSYYCRHGAACGLAGR